MNHGGSFTGPKNMRGDAEDHIELQQLMEEDHRIVFKEVSPYQEVLILETDLIRMYLDGELVWDSLDEKIYYTAFVHPAFTLVPSREKVLIIGGEDGFCLREILKYGDVQQVDMVVSDPSALKFFKKSPKIRQRNGGSLSDPRIRFLEGELQGILHGKNEEYNAIFLGFPATYGQIFKLYTEKLFQRLYCLLAKDGIMICPSFLPQEEPLAFEHTDSTLKSASFTGLNVPLPFFLHRL